MTEAGPGNTKISKASPSPAVSIGTSAGWRESGN